jgi:hypothetical protein
MNESSAPVIIRSSAVNCGVGCIGSAKKAVFGATLAIVMRSRLRGDKLLPRVLRWRSAALVDCDIIGEL